MFCSREESTCTKIQRRSPSWVQDIVRRENGVIDIIGRVFETMESSWKNDKHKISFSMFHSYIVSNLNEGSVSFSAMDVVGKGRCYCVDYDAIKKSCQSEDAEASPAFWKTPRAAKMWLFNLLGQCMEYH